MTITYEGLENFRPWSSAVPVWYRLVELDQIDFLEWLLEDMFPEGLNETALNDLLAYDTDTVVEWLGLKYDKDGDIVIEDE